MPSVRHASLLFAIAATTTAAAPATQTFVGAGGAVRLSYPASLTPGRDFGGRALMTGGWRLVWDATPVGPGTGIVRFAQTARPTKGMGQVTELVQIGVSRDAGVVARCGSSGLRSGSGGRLPNRMLGGHRWTVYRNGDAGMSQSIAATDFRSVVDGACYAIERVTYRVSAAEALPRTAPTQAAAAMRIDAILASIRVGRRR